MEKEEILGVEGQTICFNEIFANTKRYKEVWIRPYFSPPSLKKILNWDHGSNNFFISTP